jgi:hypothetical protein
MTRDTPEESPKIVKKAGIKQVGNKTGNLRINVTVRRVRVTTVAVEKQ